MTGPKPTSDLQVRLATPSDIPSLTTIVARSFHPTNDFIRQCHPDTPLVRKYWQQIFEDEIASPHCNVFVAIDPNAAPSLQVIGVICLRLLEADDQTAGLWTLHPYTPDQDAKLFQPAMDAMITARKEIFYGKGKRHFWIELFGVDYQYRGTGLGRKLLERVGEKADEEGLETFVEANASAVGIYKRLGFEERGSVRLENEMGYVEFMLVRPGNVG